MKPSPTTHAAHDGVPLVSPRPVDDNASMLSRDYVDADWAAIWPIFQEIVVAGDPAHTNTQAMIHAVQRSFLPNKVLLLRSQGTEGKRLASLSAFVEVMSSVNNQPTVYVCENYACKAPIKDLDALKAILN